MLRSVKKSIVGNKSTPHFGATGQYFSFGVNALYKIDHKNVNGRIDGDDRLLPIRFNFKLVIIVIVKIEDDF